MKARLSFLLIILFFLTLFFPLIKAPIYLSNNQNNSTSNNSKDKRQVVSNWLKARLQAQINGNSSEAWQREVPTNFASLQNFTKDKKFVIPSNILPKLSKSLQNYFYQQAINEPFPLAVSDNFQINDPALETGARVQNNTASAVSGDNIVVAYNDIGTRISAVSYSNDGGESWKTTHIPELTGGRNFGSGVVAAQGKVFYYTGLAVTAQGQPAIIFSRSDDAGKTWSSPGLVAAPSGSAFQDKPWIAVDTSKTSTQGNVYIGWTDFTVVGANIGSRIVCATSKNSGDSFTRPVILTPADTSLSVQGVTIAIGPDGDVNLAWGDDAAAGIIFARSNDGGLTFTPPVLAASLETYVLLGIFLNSHFDANGLPSLAVDSSTSANRGTLYLTFSSPSPSKQTDRSDVFFVRSTSQGATWSQVSKVNDDNTLTDQFMPSIAVSSDGTVGLMWYDRRNDELFNGMLEVYGTTSSDGGLSFSQNQRISNSSWAVLTTPVGIRSNYHGDYNQMSAVNGGFFFNWGDDRSGKDPDVYGIKKLLPFNNSNFILAPVTPAQTIIAGQRTQFRLKALNASSPFTLSARSDTNSISFEFENRNTANGQMVNVRAITNSNTSLGTHPVIITATSSDGAITNTTLRLNVISDKNNSFPLNVSKSISRSIQPHTVIDKQGAINSVWSDDRTGALRIYYSRSTDNGISFTDPVDVSLTDNANISPQISIAPDNSIHIAWQECPDIACQISYSRSTDQGKSFSEPKNISPDIEFSELPSIITNPNGEVVVFWDAAKSLGEAKFEIFASKSSNNGEIFSFPNAVVSDGGRNLFTTAATSDGKGTSYLAYESCSSGNCRIEIKRSQNGFDTFVDGATASGDLSFAIRPALATTGNGVIQAAMTVSLPGQGNRFEIFASTSNNNGDRFNTPKNVSRTTETSNDASILTINQQVYIAWRDLSTGDPDILLVKSTDQGNTFSQPTNITINNTISQLPTLVSDSSNSVYLMYQDEIDGNDEIYYLRVDGNAPPAMIDSFSPASGAIGTTLTIRGRELAQTSTITIGGEPAKFFFSSATEIVAIIPDKARSGIISLTTPNGVVNSKDNFTVTTPVLTLLAPIGKEKLKAGNSFVIRWQAENFDVASFDLLLSIDGGASFPMIITQNLVATDRMFTWVVPKIKTKTARVSLVARTQNGLTFTDNSKNNFKIKAK